MGYLAYGGVSGYAHGLFFEHLGRHSASACERAEAETMMIMDGWMGGWMGTAIRGPRSAPLAGGWLVGSMGGLARGWEAVRRGWEGSGCSTDLGLGGDDGC